MNTKKQDPIEGFLVEFFKMIFCLFRNIYKGLMQLRQKEYLIGFGLCFLFSFLVVIFKGKIQSLAIPVYLQMCIYYTILFNQLIYLCIIGSLGDLRQIEYERAFSDIGFVGKNKKYPYFVSCKQEGKKKIYTFKSSISFKSWKKEKDKLETGLDCTILQFKEGSNKKIIHLVTVPSDYRIPNVILWKDEYMDPDDGVVVIGESALEPVSFDLNRTPHVLAAGETGSGKSVILHSILWQMINKGCYILMIDFKGGVEFSKRYEKYGEVIIDRDRALQKLQMLVKENETRLALFRNMEVKNLKEYNDKTGENLCRVCVFCDEIAEMLDKRGVSKEEKPIYEQLERALSSLARLSRATGINLFLGVQRPDATVLTGQIKNNIPVRISGRFADEPPSQIVLNSGDACDLPDIKGRFLYKVGADIIEFQAYKFDDVMLKDIDIQRGYLMVEQKGESQQKKEVECNEKSIEFPDSWEEQAVSEKQEQIIDSDVIQISDDGVMVFNFDDE